MILNHGFKPTDSKSFPTLNTI